MNDTCKFCHTIAKPEQIKAHPDRYGYCSKCTLPKRKVSQNVRFREKIPNANIQKYMKGVFESFVAETERLPSVFGQRNFDRLKDYVVSYKTYLTTDELYYLLDIITEYEKRWSEYIDLVLNKTKFMELSSTGGIKKKITSPEDWAAAIRNLMRILADMNQGVENMLKQYMGEKATKEKAKACHAQSVAKCAHPCKVTTTLGIKRCTYTPRK